MPLKIVDIGGNLCPMFCCDKCGEPIKGPDSGLMGWKHEEPAILLYFHKIRCDPGHEVIPFRHDLDVFMVWLQWKYGPQTKGWKDADRRADWLERM